MKTQVVQNLKRILVLGVVIVLSVMGIPNFHQNASTVVTVQAASTTGRVPMWAYMRNGSGKLTTYTSTALNRSTGYIVPGDYCKIHAFYSNGAVKVTYPTSRGSRTAYAQMSGFVAATNFSGQTKALGKRLTAYRRSTGSATIGTVYASDQVLIIARQNGRTQVQYPCSGGYKLGWVNGSYYSNTGSNPQGCVDGVTYEGNGKIRVRGWAFDRDSLGSNLQIHVYVGGTAGSGAPGYAITANVSRPDVNNAYPGVGNNHGFDSIISVSPTGNKQVYIYAINVGGGTGNPMIGSRSVNIGSNTSSSNSGTTTASASSFQMPLTNARCSWRSSTNWSWGNRSGSAARSYHLGVDIIGSSDNVLATANGTVASCGYNRANGNYVVLKHNISGQTVYSFYAHLSSYVVKKGSIVAKGTKIGTVGNTGSSSRGKHLHFAMMNKLWNGSYFGYATRFTGNKTQYGGVTYYNPVYVVQNNRLP